MTYRLITIPVSHYCEKARWALDRLGLPYREEGHLPLLHWTATRPLGNRRTVPILLRGREIWDDSTDILLHLDTQSRPEAHLYPDDPAQRAEVLALEDRFDEKLGPATRRWAYFHLLPDKALALRAVGAGVGKVELALGSAMFPLARLLLHRGLNITPQSAQRSLERIDALYAEVAERLADGRKFMVGERFSAADLAFAALSAPALLPDGYPIQVLLTDLPPEMAREIARLRATPAGAFALRMYRDHRRERVAA